MNTNKRLPGESFDDYRARLDRQKRAERQRLAGRPVWRGRTPYVKAIHGPLEKERQG